MQHPIIIIELSNGKFEDLYSDSELSFITVDRTPKDESLKISGPYNPTLEKADLTKVIEGVTILEGVLNQMPCKPCIGLEETP